VGIASAQTSLSLGQDSGERREWGETRVGEPGVGGASLYRRLLHGIPKEYRILAIAYTTDI